MSTMTSHDDQAMRRAFGAVAASGLVLSILSVVLVDVRFGASAFLGALVALANLWVLARAVRNLLSGTGSNAPWALVAVAKFFVLLGITYALVKSDLVSPLGLAAGFGALPLGILFAGVGGARGPVGARHVEESDHA